MEEEAERCMGPCLLELLAMKLPCGTPPNESMPNVPRGTWCGSLDVRRCVAGTAPADPTGVWAEWPGSWLTARPTLPPSAVRLSHWFSMVASLPLLGLLTCMFEFDMVAPPPVKSPGPLGGTLWRGFTQRDGRTPRGVKGHARKGHPPNDASARGGAQGRQTVASQRQQLPTDALLELAGTAD
eukprot:scaffold3428_cov379-Prasinococcus_capsulatus_cf.AAC.37